LEPSPARAAAGYNFDRGTFDPGLERGEFHAFAGGWNGFIPEGWVTLAQRFNVGNPTTDDS
jgi:hypothetical protein